MLITLCLTACSGGSDTKYYQLSSPAANTVAAVSTSSLGQQPHTLWIEPVTIPDALAGNGIAFQTSEVQYRLAEQNQWASPLDQQLQQTLISNLSHLMPGWLVTNTLTEGDHDTLTVTVTAFQGRWDGHAVIKGYWIYQGKQQTERQSFEQVVPLQDDGYSALVQALSQGWYQQAQQLASTLR